MDSSFFHAKRPWSRYKDFLLRSYLEPYIPKVARLNRPIVIVDCFAGPGKFGDGEVGSPLIIADAIRRWREKNTQITGQFIEADSDNFEALQEALSEHGDYCTASLGSFDETLPLIERRAKQNTVFLYVDPYSVKGLVFDRMKTVYDQIRSSSSSVEVLMNFNVAIFMRWALAALKRSNEMPDEEAVESMADDPNESVEHRTLSEIAGGEYWAEIASNDELSFIEKLQAFLAEYSERMLGSFRFVCTFWVKAKYHHQVPKYVLIFATRHPDGLRLMNDFMCEARRDFVAAHVPQNVLFDLTPEEEIVEPQELIDGIVAVVGESKKHLTRPEVRLSLLLRGFFARLTQSEINKAIGEMLKEGRLYSSTGKARINDTVQLSDNPFS